MAKDSTVNNAANKVSQSINTATNTTSAEMQDLGNEIAGAINDLGEGLKLTAKKADSDKKKENDEPDYAKLKSELNGLRVFMPEMAEIVDFLIAINTKFDTVTTRQEESSSNAPEEEKEEKDVNFDVSAKETSALSGLTSIVDIAGTGFSIVGNLLHDLTDLFTNVLSGVTSEDLKRVFVANNLTATAEEKTKEANKEEAPSASKGILQAFFQGLTGPLESIAGSMLMIGVSLAILATVQLNSQLLGTVLALQVFMLTTFTMLAIVSEAYKGVAEQFDLSGEQQGSFMFVVKQFAALVLMTSAAFLMCSVVVRVLREHWIETLTGMVAIMGTSLITMVALNLVASLMQDMVGPESSIAKTIKSFATLVLLISGLAIFCHFLYPIIVEGLQSAAIILGATMLTMLAMTLMINSLQVSAAQINAFTNMMKSVTVLIGMIAILTVVLGILPQSIITQGLIAVGLIMLLVDSMLFMLTNVIKEAEKISTENIQALMGILITTTAMIGILGVLVFVLGSMDTAALIQGLLAVTLIAAIPIVLLKVMSKIGQNAGQLPQALLGVAIAGLLTVAVAGVAWVIISMLQRFTPTMVLSTVLAVSLTTVLLIGVGAAGVALAAMAMPLLYAFPFALLGIAETGALAIAIAGVATLLGTILNQERAAQAVAAAGAIMLTTTALVVVAAGAITLAALAIPLALASGLALIAVNVLSKFLIGFTEAMTLTISIVTESFGSLNLEAFGNATSAIASTVVEFVTLSTALLAFNVISWTLVTQVYLASAALLALDIGMVQFAASYQALSLILSNLPTENLQMETLVGVISSLNDVSRSINEFVLPNPAKMIGLTFTLNFVLGFAARLGLVASDRNINRITTLSASLSELAQNANGLRDLAGAIQAVSDATKDLNDLSVKSNVSIEAISGQLTNNATEIQKLQKPAESKENPKLDQVLEQIVEAVDILRSVSENLQNVTTATKQMATVQEMNYRAPESVYLK